MAEDFGKDLNDTTGGGTQDDKLKLDPSIVAKIEEGAQAKMYAQLTSDPELRRLIELKRQGKKVQIQEEGTPVANQGNPSPEPKFEEMNEQQKMEYLVKTVRSGVLEDVKKEIAPTNENVAALLQQAQNIKRQKIESDIDQAKKQFSDFETYESRMAQIAQENKNLSVTQLYILAKAEKGQVVDVKSLTSSERPSSTTARPHVKHDIKPGVNGIRSLLPGVVAQNLSRFSGAHESED